MSEVEKSQLRQLIEAAELQGIRLVELAGVTGIRSPAGLGEISMQIGTKAETRRDPADAIVVLTGLDLKASPTTEAEEPKLTIKSVFELRYSVPADLETSQESLDRFGRLNGVYNAWPYFRELVQSVLTRMGLPPLTIPLLKTRRGSPPASSERKQPPLGAGLAPE